ncbi:MAG: hypothetical protein M1816_007530 [Peltula sp. TS41687]|nr:MAG: hypothetical protein M1816_007530 [Peltula sp. TS41687]
MSSFDPSAFISGHTLHLAGLDQTPLDDFIPASPDTEQFLQVSNRFSSSPAPPMQPSTSFASSAGQPPARFDAENVVQANTISISPSHFAAHPVHHTSSATLSNVYTHSQSHASPLAYNDPHLSATSTTDSQNPSPFTRQDQVSPEEQNDEAMLQALDDDFLSRPIEQPFHTLLSSLALNHDMTPSLNQTARPLSPSVSDEHVNQQDAWLMADPPQVPYLLSPVHTSTGAPSPGSKRDLGESKRHYSDSPALPVGPTMAPTGQETTIPIQIPGLVSLHTPEMSQGSRNSSGERLFAYLTQNTLPQNSPVVKVENFGGGGDLITSDSTGIQGPGPTWEPNRFSTTHLSPPLDSVEISQNDSVSRSLSPRMAEVTRSDDGAWMPSTVTGQAGVDPTSREQINDTYLPSLKEQEEQRQLEEKKANVEHWLVGSANPGVPADQPVRKPPLRSGGRPRARSTGDMRGPSSDPLRIDMGNGVALDDSGIPGPGLLLDVQSDCDEEDDELYETESNVEAELDITPPAPQRPTEVDAVPLLDYFTATPDAEPDPSQFIGARPWVDPPSTNEPTETRVQPFSSMAAIMQFKQRADNLETASRVATWGTRRTTWGTRRMSDTAVEELTRSRPALKRLSLGRDKDKSKGSGDKKSLLEVGRLLKRQRSVKSVSEQANESTDKTRNESVPTLVLSRSPSKSSRTLKVNTGASIVAATAGQVAALGGGASFTSRPMSPPTSTWEQAKEQAKNAIRRSRSKSDITRKADPAVVNAPHLSTLIAQVGGPPVLPLSSPTKELEATRPTPIDEDDEDENDDDDLGEGAGVEMDLTVRYGDIIPTLEGFQFQVRQLNPRLEPFLVDRVSQEQLKRYTRLVDCKVKHHQSVRSGKCSSNRYCLALGGEAKILPPKGSQRELGGSTTEYRYNAAPVMDAADRSGDGAVALAQFPRGVPLPRVKRLPAELECPLCFKVKNFYKPSDWTKHVHEDVEPFTCTFPNCADPKSFKRKADWVRHENEKHRQLERWTCNLGDCAHTCYRKDNFVQHLVREHKRPEPKVKTTRAALKGSAASKKVVAGHSSVEDVRAASSSWVDSNQEEINKLWELVEACRHTTTKASRQEPCRFCGNICSSWKKLTVHLAKHMQQISLPVLTLVEQYDVNEDRHTGVMGRGIASHLGGSMIEPTPGSRMEQRVNATSAMPPSNIPTNGTGRLGYGYQANGPVQQQQQPPPLSGTNRPPMAAYNMPNSQYTGGIPFHRASYPGQNHTSSTYPRPAVAPPSQSTPFASDPMYVRQPSTMTQAVYNAAQQPQQHQQQPGGGSGYPPSSNGMTSTTATTTTISNNSYPPPPPPPFNSQQQQQNQQQQYVNNHSTVPTSNGNAYLYVGGASDNNFPSGSTGASSYGTVNGTGTGTGYQAGTYMPNNNQTTPTHYPYQRR